MDWTWEGARDRGSEREVRKVRVRLVDCWSLESDVSYMMKMISFSPSLPRSPGA